MPNIRNSAMNGTPGRVGGGGVRLRFFFRDEVTSSW